MCDCEYSDTVVRFLLTNRDKAWVCASRSPGTGKKSVVPDTKIWDSTPGVFVVDNRARKVYSRVWAHSPEPPAAFGAAQSIAHGVAAAPQEGVYGDG